MKPELLSLWQISLQPQPRLPLLQLETGNLHLESQLLPQEEDVLRDLSSLLVNRVHKLLKEDARQRLLCSLP